MDWVDELATKVHTPLPDSPPDYWGNGLIKHLNLPDQWPVNWESEGIQEKAFTLFLEFFDPPYNLQGLSHQLIPLEFIVNESAKLELITPEHSKCLELFLDQVRDYISTCPKEEKEVLTANKLNDITNLGLWRFHYHCSQVIRKKIDAAFYKRITTNGDRHKKIINVSKLKYLRDGLLDKIYQSIACEMHLRLRRAQLLRTGERKEKLPAEEDDQPTVCETTASTKKHIIYTEVLACEHCLHLAHHLIQKQPTSKIKKIALELKRAFRLISDKDNKKLKTGNGEHASDTVIELIAGHIKTVHRLLSTFGRIKTKRSGPRKKFTPRPGRQIGRLLPLGRYEESTKESESTAPVQIEDPLSIINGIPDDISSEALLRRKYGRRPKISTELGESEEDYKAPNSVNISASWLLDPYRNSIKQRVQMESLIVGAEPPAWSSQCLMVATINRYILNTSSYKTDAKLLSIMALHTGLDERLIQSIRIGIPPIFALLDNPNQIPHEDFKALIKEAESKWMDLYLDPETGIYSYLLPKGKSSYHDEYSPDYIQGCMEASRIIRVPLPSVVKQPLNTWIEKLREKHYGCFCTDPNEPTTYLKLFRNWKKVSNEWADIMRDTGLMCFENVTPSRIRSTFRALYVGQMGVAPMYANLIMGYIQMNLRAQHFYANLSYQTLQTQYHYASETIVRILSGQNVPAISLDTKVAGPENNSSLCFGSRLVPTNERLTTYFSELHASFISDIEKMIISPMMWNKMMLYVFRLLQLATGIRPARDSLPDWSNISFKSNWIRLSDKDNLHYYEARVIPLATRLNQWLRYLGSVQSKCFIGMNFRGHQLPKPFRDKPTQSIFVFMDTERKIVRPFTFDDITLIEDAASITEPFNFKANALRHNLLTRLHESDVDQHIIDFVTGHKHFGHEPFGRFSPISSNKYANLAIQHLDESVINPVQIPEPPSYG
ncbi:MAG: hypothetical protein RQ867_04925 [Mariprofundaceae bacterium]|nr:hypothetical protein [Mariprofundaceae bacterium]